MLIQFATPRNSLTGFLWCGCMVNSPIQVIETMGALLLKLLPSIIIIYSLWLYNANMKIPFLMCVLFYVFILVLIVFLLVNHSCWVTEISGGT